MVESPDQIQVVSPQELKAMIEGGADIVIVDVQPAEAYAMGHIPGAKNLPWAAMITSTRGLPMSKLIVVYCACPPEMGEGSSDSGDVAFQLISNFGYQKVALLKGGWLTWQELGYPVEK